VHVRAVAGLKALGIAAGAGHFKVGAKSPSFELPDHTGNASRSAELLGKGRLVLQFIRGAGVRSASGRWRRCLTSPLRLARRELRWLPCLRQTRSSLSLCTISTSLRFRFWWTVATNAPAVRAGLPRLRRTAGALRSTFVNFRREWRFQLGVGDSATFVIDRDGTILFAFGERGLYGSAERWRFCRWSSPKPAACRLRL